MEVCTEQGHRLRLTLKGAPAANTFGKRSALCTSRLTGAEQIFVTARGLGTFVRPQPTFKATFTRGAQWAAIGKATLPAPAEMAR